MSKEKEILKIIKEHFTLYVEPKYKATLQLQQHTTMTISDYEKIIKYFGEPRDE